MLSGTRPAVVAAVIHSSARRGRAGEHIVIWDKHEDDLRAAGFFKLATQLGVRAAGCAEAGYDPTNFISPTPPSSATWFGRSGVREKRRRCRAKILCFQKSSGRQITKIISVAPLLNREDAGVCGHLYAWPWAVWTTPCGSSTTRTARRRRAGNLRSARTWGTASH